MTPPKPEWRPRVDGTRAAAATTSHCLLQLSSDTVAAPPVCAAGPAPPRPAGALIGRSRRHSSVAAALNAAPIGRVPLGPSPPALPSVPLRNPAPPAPLPSAADCG
ncbi:atherin-like [Zalophus californianus]|uniref:Atherin-like n=1 Tax=Zalophus californianus TaxID=9704 RepID=A0A6J2F7S0_ZALCA|nr:atherin-like [Zalophus californianus]